MLVNIPLRLAIADFRESIRNPDFTAFHCYRAIESLRHEFIGKDKKEQWEMLRNNLKVKEETIKTMKDSAVMQRHGAIGTAPWEKRKEQMYTAWLIISKFILFKKGLQILTEI